MSISLSDAEKILQAAQKQAASMGINVSVAVVDPRGDLVALARMDGARYFTADIARGKAMTSASFGAPSGAFAEHAGSPVFKAINDSNLGRMVFHQGAVPLFKGGTLSGGVGVSGASSQQDEDVAKAGAAACS